MLYTTFILTIATATTLPLIALPTIMNWAVMGAGTTLCPIHPVTAYISRARIA
jgi:hypothetical protein